MGNFANNQREQQKREERESTAREVLGKTFHDLGKTSFAVMVVGNMSPLFGLSEMSVWQTLSNHFGRRIKRLVNIFGQ